ncbi:uncharacterized protein MELLADRAFT_70058 [Melampsora larici-populina 98AG31]|uniref:Uncharacterized protein n=1 Tax=Melampsora larici-populina (strain 98AG31 / pathotype 3-4-7) TaxID=747676 RepID=F4SDD5_MELLP|nr:uncharacterized protein MELLADRAFT_70058 [Melampsora larici-populina 98AG31]EGF97343.1 hypothetical protein MELLADRAFT_70058 [Melampsora larici-populina 98AG31]
MQFPLEDTVAEKATAFRFEYRIRPFPHFAGIRKILKAGREVIFHGFIHDFNKTSLNWVVIVNKISLTNGSQQGKEPFKPRYSVPKGLTSNTFSKRNENVVPDSDKDDKGISHHYIDNASTSGSSNGQTKPPNLPFPPSDFNSSSYLPASKAATTSPPKKRARATPKKRATRGKTLDISND